MIQHRTAHRPASVSLAQAWRAQVSAAQHSPWLLRALTTRGDLFPRFAQYYTRLTVLPRRTRRALQTRLARSLAGAALLLALSPSPALPAELVSVNSGGTASGNDYSHDPQVSADGTVVVFDGYASDLDPLDTNGYSDVFVRTGRRGRRNW